MQYAPPPKKKVDNDAILNYSIILLIIFNHFIKIDPRDGLLCGHPLVRLT